MKRADFDGASMQISVYLQDQPNEA